MKEGNIPKTTIIGHLLKQNFIILPLSIVFIALCLWHVNGLVANTIIKFVMLVTALFLVIIIQKFVVQLYKTFCNKYTVDIQKVIAIRGRKLRIGDHDSVVLETQNDTIAIRKEHESKFSIGDEIFLVWFQNEKVPAIIEKCAK